MGLDLEGFLPGKIERYLDDNGITHRTIQSLPDNSQNLTFTDFDRVFVKVFRRPEGVYEIRNTLLALQYGMDAPKPLLHEGEWCSVWEYRNLFPFTMAHLPEAMGMIRRLHESTRDLELLEPMTFPYQYEVIANRFHSENKNHPEKNFICDLSADLCEKLAKETAGRPMSLIHGDLQFTNMGTDFKNTTVVFDWEISKNAAPELELSKTEGNLMENEVWTPHWWKDTYGELDEDYLKLASQLRFCQNIAFDIERGASGLTARRLATLRRYFSL